LFVEQRLQVLVAVVRVVALGAAGIVLVEGLVRVVDAVAGEVEADGIVVARDLREPLARLNRVELRVDIDGS
jgi:hypothetical protein